MAIVFVVIILATIPVILYLTTRERPELEPPGPATRQAPITSPAIDGPGRQLPCGPVRLTAVLSDELTVLVGYTAAGQCGGVDLDVAPSRYGTLVLEVGASRHGPTLEVLDSWRRDGATVTLRSCQSGRVVELCDPATTRSLVLPAAGTP
jgi:hypothetical protein